MEVSPNSIKEKEQNVYARLVDSSIIHISEAQSGRKGYFCIGCGGIMQAKKGKRLVHHFSHEPRDVTRIGKCTYSDETHRHKMAKDILQINKQIKVPTLYKYPPKGIEGVAVKLKDSEVIRATSVGIELYFYEDEDGTIRYTQDAITKEATKKVLLIKPDVTFFDHQGVPILIIEIVATHKVNDEKLSKIRKLGINTVQVTIPKDSPQAIEKTFYNTERTKWLFNHEEANTNYLSISYGTSEGISIIDELQRELFEESFRCRAIQVRNLIRSIEKCLESEQYRSVVSNLRNEIRRVESNSASNQQQLFGIQRGLQEEVEAEFEAETGRVKSEEISEHTEFRSKRQAIERKYSELEGRYNTKRESLIDEQSKIEELERGIEPESQSEIKRIEKYLERLGFGSRSLEERIEEIREEEIDFEREVEYQERGIEREKDEVERIYGDFLLRTESLPAEFQQREDALRTEFERKTEQAQLQYERDCRATISEIQGRNSKGISPFSNRIKEFMDGRQCLSAIEEAIVDLKRKRAAREFFEKKPWKGWG
ncbi:hypothetical protein ACWA1C_20185 [Flectobacillus roseus]